MSIPTKTPKTLVAVIAAATLTACGGGGDKGPSPTFKTLSVETAEGQQKVVTLSGLPQSVERIRGTQAITLDTKADDGGKTLMTVTTGELENEGEARFKVITKNGEKQIITTVSVDAENTSAKKPLSRVQTIQGLSSAHSVLADDITLANVILELEYLAGKLDSNEVDDLRDTIDQGLNQVSAELSKEISRLPTLATKYKSGEITESEVSATIQNIEAHIADIGPAGEIILSTFTGTLGRLGINLPTNLNDAYPLTYNETLKRYTRFASDDLGTLNPDGTFTFHPDNDFLNSVFAFATTNATK